MILRRIPPMLLLLLVCSAADAAKLSIVIEGLPDDLRDAAQANLGLQQLSGRDVTRAQVRRAYSQADKQLRTALEPYGYYNVRVEKNLAQNGDTFETRFHVVPGDPVVVRNSSVKVEGEGAERPAVRRAVRRFSPAVGERFDHGLYEQSKSAVEAALLGQGYLRAAPLTHRVEVSRRANSADIDVSWRSGPRFTFGAVRFSESQLRPGFLDRYVPWSEGDFYSPDELVTLQQKLVDADYFSTVTVQPNLKQAEGTKVPIDVTVVPAKRSVYSSSLYISTDTGPGVQLGLQRRWINDRGHKLGTSLDVAQRLSALTTNYQIPRPGPNERAFNFGATYRDENTATTQSRTARVAANETRKWYGFDRTIGLQYLAGDFEIASEQRTSTLLFAEGTLSKKVANDLFFPRRGYSLNLDLRFAPEGPLSDTSLAQIRADARWIRSLRNRQRLLLRGSLGAMIVDDFNMLPPELRFFAGGDRSIRGFDYQSLGTTNDAGEVIGGEMLALGSIEYEKYLWRSWGVALFVDGGDAFRSGEFDLNIGAGIGLRWRSPVGVLRVDIAKPVKSDLADQIRLHISVGPDL